MNDNSIDYSVHPSFPFGLKTWQVDTDSLDRFNVLYEEGIGGDLAVCAELKLTCDQIRRSISLQIIDRLEQQFIDELFNEVEKMALQHVKYLGKLEHDRPNSISNLGKELSDNRYYVVSLSDACLKEITAITTSLVEILRGRAKQGILSREQLSINGGRRIRRIVRCLNKEFKTSGVIESLRTVSIGPMEVVGAALELSAAGSTWWKNSHEEIPSRNVLYAHLDQEVDAPKSIVYLSDVKSQNGPTTCYPEVYRNLSITKIQDLVGRAIWNLGKDPTSPLWSAYQRQDKITDSNLFKEHFMKLPEQMRFNSHFGWDVVPGSAIEKFMLTKETIVTGEAGTSLVFDGGTIVHRGGLIQEGERIVLQVVFGPGTWADRIKKYSRQIMSRTIRRTPR